MDACWYVHEDDDEYSKQQRAKDLFATTAAIEQDQSQWYQFALYNSVLFNNRAISGFSSGVNEPSTVGLTPSNMLTENLIQSKGETLIAKAASSPVRPVLYPRGASFKTYRRVREANKWIQGSWKSLRAELKCLLAFTDAFESGIGCIKVEWDAQDEALCIENVFYDNLVINNRECANREQPLEYRLRTTVPIEAVERRWPGVEFDPNVLNRDHVRHRQLRDGWTVMVEAWRLPSYGCPGRHVVAVGGTLVVDEEWDHPTTNLVFFTPYPPTTGFYGRSGVEKLIPHQLRLNRLNEVIEDAQDLVCRPRLLAHAGSRFSVAQLDNRVAKALFYTGIEPKPLNWSTNMAELYEERERTRRVSGEDIGLSEMSSSAVLPQGVRLDSSQGVKQFRNMEDGRHLPVWMRYEEFRLEVARKIVEVMIWNPGANPKTVFQGGGRARIETIDFEALRDLEEEEFTWSLEALPASSASPAVQRDDLEQAAAGGQVPQGSLSLTSLPDAEFLDQVRTSGSDYARFVVEEAQEGRVVTPDPVSHNIELTVLFMRASLRMLLQMEDVDREVILAHESYIRQAAAHINTPQTMIPPPAASPPTDQGVMPSPGTAAPPAAIPQ